MIEKFIFGKFSHNQSIKSLSHFIVYVNLMNMIDNKKVYKYKVVNLSVLIYYS